MSTRKRKAVTAYGELEYDTVECVHCGSDVVSEQAVTVGAGFYETTCSGVSICDAVVERPEHKVVMCEYCAESILNFNGSLGPQEIAGLRWISHTGPIVWALIIGSAFLLGFLMGIPV